MNNINRAVVKQQAKDIIKNKVFYLFLITAIVTFLTGSGMNFSININDNDFELFRHKDNSQSDYYDNGSDNDIFDDWDNPIENFEFNNAVQVPEVTELSVNHMIAPNTAAIRGLAGSSVLVAIIFLPLGVTLSGMYLSLVRRNPAEEFVLGKELGGIFKNTFNETYLKKLLLELLTGALSVALLLLLIVPGVIFNYSAYFSQQIMSDNPSLKPSEAIKLSKKMVMGNRTELFVLDLSFVGWFLIGVVTFGVGFVYVLPYYYTTRALYYENFRMRALQEGRITVDDFKSFDERYAQYTQNNNNADNTSQGTYYYTNENPADNSADYYYSPQDSDNSEQ